MAIQGWDDEKGKEEARDEIAGSRESSLWCQRPRLDRLAS